MSVYLCFEGVHQILYSNCRIVQTPRPSVVRVRVRVRVRAHVHLHVSTIRGLIDHSSSNCVVMYVCMRVYASVYAHM